MVPGWGAVERAANAGAQLGDLQRAMDSMPADIRLDPRIDEALASWAACMTTAGYPGLRQFLDAENLVIDIVNDFTTANYSKVDLSLGETEFDAINETEFDAIKASIPGELADVQAEEIAIAVADATCREESGYIETRRDVENEYEQAIVDTYRDDLEAWVAAAQASRAEQDG